MNPTITILAVRELAGALDERARSLAEILGITLFEARPRVQPPGPRVVATYQDIDEANARAAGLARAGFQPLVLSGDALQGQEEPVRIRGFSLHSDGLVLIPRSGPAYDVRHQEVQLILAAVRARHESHVETTTVKKFSFGKAVMTGGKVRSKKQKVETVTHQNEFNFFVQLYTRGYPPFVLSEEELQYQGLGAALQPVRHANFRILVQELRSRAPAAPYDDRLNSAAGQLKLLGNTLPADRFLDLGLTLLAVTHLNRPHVQQETP